MTTFMVLVRDVFLARHGKEALTFDQSELRLHGGSLLPEALPKCRRVTVVGVSPDAGDWLVAVREIAPVGQARERFRGFDPFRRRTNQSDQIATRGPGEQLFAKDGAATAFIESCFQRLGRRVDRDRAAFIHGGVLPGIKWL